MYTFTETHSHSQTYVHKKLFWVILYTLFMFTNDVDESTEKSFFPNEFCCWSWSLSLTLTKRAAKLAIVFFYELWKVRAEEVVAEQDKWISFNLERIETREAWPACAYQGEVEYFAVLSVSWRISHSDPGVCTVHYQKHFWVNRDWSSRSLFPQSRYFRQLAPALQGRWRKGLILLKALILIVKSTSKLRVLFF